ncbi:MAG: B12-binding domain-containing radical SAM protein [Myxococcales bacterium]|nr:B12-binding domain-containing radical SAM protein [Myxococcales bacterium]
MSDVLFGQSYFLRFDPKLWDAMAPYPPLGSLQAAAVVREMGLDVAVFDAMLADSEVQFTQALTTHNPRYAVLFEDNFNYLSKMCLTRMRDAALTMIRAAHSRGAKVIVCGSDATDHAKTYLDAGADFVIRGEGDATLRELMLHLEGSETKLTDILGLTWQTGAGLQQTPARPVMRELDALPMPAWDLIDIEPYRALWQAHHGYFSLNLVTTRGCPFHCNWCAKPIWGQRYNSHSPERIVELQAALVERYNPDHIWFMDDIMGLKKGWLSRYGELAKSRGVSRPFKCLSRADLLLRRGEIEALASAGCDIVWIGAESGSQKVLDAMDKGTEVGHIEQTAERLHAAGVRVAFFLQFGYPGEQREDIELTRQMIRTCKPDDIGISVSYPLPGTPFYERVRSQLGDKQNWVDSSDLDMLYKGPFNTAFYRQLHTVIHKEYRSAKIWRQLRAGELPVGRKVLKRAARMAWDRLSLPLAERTLDRLAAMAHDGAPDLSGGMTFAEAAAPTPQDPN